MFEKQKGKMKTKHSKVGHLPNMRTNSKRKGGLLKGKFGAFGAIRLATTRGAIEAKLTSRREVNRILKAMRTSTYMSLKQKQTYMLVIPHVHLKLYKIQN